MIDANNPFNLEWNERIPWQGLAGQQLHLPYCTFISPTMGLRAGMIDARTKIRKHGLNTLNKLIPVFAPATENNAPAYIADVAQRLGIDADDLLTLDTVSDLVAYAKAIVRHENGACPTAPDWYDDATYDESAQMALSNDT